jgi:predicted glycosyltransferase
LLSRFSDLKDKEVKETGSYDLLISISGPEPQRTILENRLTEQALKLPYKTLMVVGKTEDGKENVDIAENFKKVAHLNAERMYSAMRDAKYIICRSGYSTVMDLAALAQRAAFIPTPGQSEQEYLAEKYKTEGLANFMAQDDVNIEQLIADYENYKGFGGFDNDSTILDNCLDLFLQRVETYNPY